MSQQVSLTSLMNDMVGRLDDLLPEHQDFRIPEESYWHLIGVYIQIDSVLARLYKQYCEAKDHLGSLLSQSSPEDPLLEVAWDMHDSLRSAIDTRLIELKGNPAIRDKADAIQYSMREKARAEETLRKRERENSSMENIINFLIWTSLVFKDHSLRDSLAHDFAQAS